MSLLRFWVTVVLFLSAIRLLVYRLPKFIQASVPEKDSVFFLKKYIYFTENGWYESIVKGTSPVYNAMIFIIDYFLVDPYESMKLLNIISMIFMLIIWMYFAIAVIKVPKKYIFTTIVFLIYLSFYRSAYFYPTNDPLFSLFISIGLVFLCQFIKNKSKPHIYWSSLFFCLAFGTREIFVFYSLGLIFIVIILFWDKRINIKQFSLIVGIFIVGTLLIYYPSIIENKTFKFADKNEAVKGNWAERNYLQILLDDPNLTFEDVDTFKLKNPQVETPKSYTEAIFLSPQLTLTNFLQQLILIVKPFIWQIGVLFLIVVFNSIRHLKLFDFLDLNVVSVILFVFFSISFSMLLINRVEFRWFMVFPYLLSILGIAFLAKGTNKAYLELIFLINCLVISYLNFNL